MNEFIKKIDNVLYEYLSIIKPSCKLYCDPKFKKLRKKKNYKNDEDMSLLVGGSKDRKRFIKNIYKRDSK